jgi:hypothetical protein
VDNFLRKDAALEEHKTKSLKNIEEKMEGLDVDSLRYHVLESAKNFKSSWIELGRSLYAVWKDKKYKEWGYTGFEAYAAREIGIRQQTAMKLLKSYYFLEKEEPQYLKDEYSSAALPANIPGYESVNLLRQAKNNKNLDEEDYSDFKKEVFEKGRDPRDLKKSLGVIIRQRQELDPEAAALKRRNAVLNRLLGQLKSLKQEVQALKLLPAPLIRDLDELIRGVGQEVKG